MLHKCQIRGGDRYYRQAAATDRTASTNYNIPDTIIVYVY